MLDKQLYWLKNRTLINVTGQDALKFLQNLITNDLVNLKTNLVYSALLTPQGKYLFDFFIIKKSNTFFMIDISSTSKEIFLNRMHLYKLRSNIKIEQVNGRVAIGISQKPRNAFFDPRCKELGWRQYFTGSVYPSGVTVLDKVKYDKIRITNRIPETDIELIKDKTYILEAGFERLSGVSFTKGCYVGQEVTARMRHKTELQKGLVKIRIIGDVNSSTHDILYDGTNVGTVFTKVEDCAIAYLKFKYEQLSLTFGAANVEIIQRF